MFFPNSNSENVFCFDSASKFADAVAAFKRGANVFWQDGATYDMLTTYEDGALKGSKYSVDANGATTTGGGGGSTASLVVNDGIVESYELHLVIPEGVTGIGDSAFDSCTGLTSVTIPEGVTSIGASAFNNCTGLTSVTIPESVTSIEEYTFGWCTGLTSVTIPEGVTSIGASAFYNCTGLTSVTIPESVTSIEEYAFDSCTGLTSVTVKATDVPSLGANAFRYTDENLIIYVPAESLDAYKAAEVWDTYESQIQAIAE